MVNMEKNLVLVKHEDKTENIHSWRYAGVLIEVTFLSGKKYAYAPSNVEIYKDPITFSASEAVLLVRGKKIPSMSKVQLFERHARVFYTTGRYHLFDAGEIEVVRSGLVTAQARNCLLYLKKIAHAIGLRSEQTGESLLGRQYDRIEFVRADSVFSAFLNGTMPQAVIKNSRAPIYPFGLNLSQKMAVDRALENPLSIIEGPPGTGKTQTILNIIANAVVSGKSVAVVSGNNAATGNVQEKLKKDGFDFLCAALGNGQNKQEFINQQPDLPELAEWEVSKDEEEQLRKHLQTQFAELREMLDKQNRLSELRSLLENVTLENEHFLQYYKETYDHFPQEQQALQKMDAKKALALWAVYEIAAECGKTSRWQRLKNRLRFGRAAKAVEDFPPEQVIAICQKQYYTKVISQTEAEIKAVEEVLSQYSFEEKLQKYTEISMRMFRAALCSKYHGRKREKYGAEDLSGKSAVFAQDYPVVLSTTHSLRGSLSAQIRYDYVIVDEASQVDLVSGALALSCAKNAVIVGDLKQLPNVVNAEQTKISDEIFQKSQLKEVYRYANHSLLQSTSELFPEIPRTLLREHYRCHPKIIDFCNKKFYDDQLIVLTKMESDRPPLAVYRTRPGNHARDHINQRQIEVIRDEIIPNEGLNPQIDSIGIVTPYRNQTNALQNAFAETDIKADTVDKFQGRENDVIVLSTVDNAITEFTDNANRLNVAVSRAIQQLIVVVNGNEEKNDTNMSDLIAYVQYNNLTVTESEIYSVFDNLFGAYAEKRRELLKGKRRISAYDSENLVYDLLQKILKQERFCKYGVAVHVPLNMILRETEKLEDDALVAYAMNPLTHVDFLVFNKLGKCPVLAVEVDGVGFHADGSKQAERDKMKDVVLAKYKLPLLRLRTDGSREKERIEEKLLQIQSAGKAEG